MYTVERYWTADRTIREGKAFPFTREWWLPREFLRRCRLDLQDGRGQTSPLNVVVEKNDRSLSGFSLEVPESETRESG